MTSPTPYTIDVPSKKLEQLNQRLETAILPDQLEGPDHWHFGAPVSDVSRLVQYWRHEFDWRKTEKSLNELPNYKTNIDVDDFGALDIHFVHQVSPIKGAIPLLFLHGWPGSFLKVSRLLPLLKGSDTETAFHVVAPSLPNFGFSSGVNRKGFTLTEYAETVHKLMLQLGYDRYVTQGGDWGQDISRAIGLQYPSHCLASHINLVLAYAPKWFEQPLLALQHALSPYTLREKKGRERSAWIDDHGMGYNNLQSTKPQTIGYALADSPVALLAWIYEKLHDWTDDYPWTDDEILTWVSIYWFSTAGPAASVRIYYEATYPQPHSNVTQWTLRKYIPHVKLALAHFPRKINVVPHTWAHTLGPVVQQTVHEQGGHFAAWEQPRSIAADLEKMFGNGGSCLESLMTRQGSDTKSGVDGTCCWLSPVHVCRTPGRRS